MTFLELFAYVHRFPFVGNSLGCESRSLGALLACSECMFAHTHSVPQHNSFPTCPEAFVPLAVLCARGGGGTVNAFTPVVNPCPPSATGPKAVSPSTNSNTGSRSACSYQGHPGSWHSPALLLSCCCSWWRGEAGRKTQAAKIATSSVSMPPTTRTPRFRGDASGGYWAPGTPHMQHFSHRFIHLAPQSCFQCWQSTPHIHMAHNQPAMLSH